MEPAGAGKAIAELPTPYLSTLGVTVTKCAPRQHRSHQKNSKVIFPLFSCSSFGKYLIHTHARTHACTHAHAYTCAYHFFQSVRDARPEREDSVVAVGTEPGKAYAERPGIPDMRIHGAKARELVKVRCRFRRGLQLQVALPLLILCNHEY